MSSTSRSRPYAVPVLVLGALSQWAGPAVAAQAGARGTPGNQLEFTLSAGAGYLDNVEHVATDTRDEVISFVGARLTLLENRPRLDADIQAAFDYRRYSSDSYSGELFAHFNGQAQVQLVPEVFEWSFSDDLAEVYSRQVGPDTPDEREHLNHFTTGPTLRLRLAERTEVLLGGQFSDTRFSRTKDADSQRLGGSIGLARQISPRSRVMLNATHSVLQFTDASLAPDIRQDSAYLGFNALGARTTLSLDAGYSSVDPDGAAPSQDGLMLRLAVSRRVTRRSALELTAGRIFTDSGERLRVTEHRDFSGIDTQLIAPSAGSFDSRYGSLLWTTELNRTTFQVLGQYNKDSYSNQPPGLGRSRIHAGSQLVRAITERATLAFGVHYIYEKQNNDDYRGDWVRGMVELDWRMSRTISAQLQLSHDARHSSEPDLRYSGSQAWLRVNYNPKAGR